MKCGVEIDGAGLQELVLFCGKGEAETLEATKKLMGLQCRSVHWLIKQLAGARTPDGAHQWHFAFRRVWRGEVVRLGVVDGRAVMLGAPDSKQPKSNWTGTHSDMHKERELMECTA